jgi:hypothetical protein
MRPFDNGIGNGSDMPGNPNSLTPPSTLGWAPAPYVGPNTLCPHPGVCLVNNWQTTLTVATPCTVSAVLALTP